MLSPPVPVIQFPTFVVLSQGKSGCSLGREGESILPCPQTPAATQSHLQQENAGLGHAKPSQSRATQLDRVPPKICTTAPTVPPLTNQLHRPGSACNAMLCSVTARIV